MIRADDRRRCPADAALRVSPFSVPPYVGQHGWIGVALERVDPEEMGELLEDAWRATAPKRVVAAYDSGG